MTIAEVFDVPEARHCLDAMEAWLGGEPVPSYDRILQDWGPEFMCWRRRWQQRADRMLKSEDDYRRSFNVEMALMEVRFIYVARFGFAVPCAELLDALSEASPIIEVAAGSGYMTRLMRNRGIDVIGSDFDQSGEDSGHGFVVGVHDPCQISGVQAKTMVRRHSDRAVFCSWPTLKHTWFRQMLRAMRIGQELIVIREEACAEDSAWDYIDSCFEHRRDIELPCFPGMHDWAGLYVKRRQDAQTKARTALLGRRRQLSRRAPAAQRRRTSKAA